MTKRLVNKKADNCKKDDKAVKTVDKKDDKKAYKADKKKRKAPAKSKRRASGARNKASVVVQIFFALSASFTAAAAPVQSRRTTDNTDARRHA